MTAARKESLVAVAFAHTAEVQGWRLFSTEEEREHIERTLHHLFDLGHIAGFSIRLGEKSSVEALISELRSRVGDLVVEVCRTTKKPSINSLPSFLMPIWAFDYTIDGAPASTGRCLGLDLELIATPSPDEELGAHLPGRVGRWLIHARPLF